MLRVIFSLVANYLRVVVPSPKIVVNLPRAYEKLHCKGEPAVRKILWYRQTYIQIQTHSDIFLLY